MPDFNKIIQGLKDQRKQNVVDNGPISPEERNRRSTERLQNLAKRPSPNEPKWSGNSDSISNINNQEDTKKQGMEL